MRATAFEDNIMKARVHFGTPYMPEGGKDSGNTDVVSKVRFLCATGLV